MFWYADTQTDSYRHALKHTQIKIIIRYCDVMEIQNLNTFSLHHTASIKESNCAQSLCPKRNNKQTGTHIDKYRHAPKHAQIKLLIRHCDVMEIKTNQHILSASIKDFKRRRQAAWAVVMYNASGQGTQETQCFCSTVHIFHCVEVWGMWEQFSLVFPRNASTSRVNRFRTIEKRPKCRGCWSDNSTCAHAYFDYSRGVFLCHFLNIIS